MPDKFSIGEHVFVRLSGPPLGLSMEVDAETYPARDTSFWLVGNRANLQEISSLSDPEDVAQGEQWLGEFRQLQEEGPQPITWDGRELEFNVKVVRVQLAPRGLRKIVLGRGGPHSKDGNSARARLECIWTLLPVPKPEPEEE